ncbi:MAG TPA: cyclase family protein [Chthoniobacterales bacterium]|jgi:kynurenine formamidase
MKFIDLSHPLVHGQTTFPMDPKLSIIPHSTIQTLKYNMTAVSMATHQGTHLDAMFHFFDDGKTVDQMPLDWFYGEAVLLRIPKNAGEELTVQDFEKYEALLQPGAKVIYETGWHRHFGQEDYFSAFPSLTQEAARYLVSRRIRMLGMDTPTPSRDWVEVHHILLAKDAEIVVVESLANLDQVPDRFTFCGFPLNFKGRDGSPIRAVAIVP